VFNIVQGGAELGNALTSDPGIRRISFTGSAPTARIIGRNAAENIVPFTAELGGKSALLVFEDADIDAAAKKAAGQYDDSGQVCMAGSRLIVQDSVKEEFLSRFHAYTDQHVLGDSRDPATTVSAMIHPIHVERVLGFIERARAGGDEIVRGGKRRKEGANWVEPTLIVPKHNECEVVQNEVFGPVLTFQTFSDEAEGVALANSTAYGLSGVIYTGNAERAERVGRQVRGGTVWVNTFLVRDLTAPFGGIGISGIGREGGNYALDFHSWKAASECIASRVRQGDGHLATLPPASHRVQFPSGPKICEAAVRYQSAPLPWTPRNSDNAAILRGRSTRSRRERDHWFSPSRGRERRRRHLGADRRAKD